MKPTRPIQYLLTGLQLNNQDRQWGRAYETTELSLPLSVNILSMAAVHEGSTKQIVSYSETYYKWVGDESGNYIYYIAITK